MKARPASTNQVEPRFVGTDQVASGIDAQGREIPDSTPMSPPVGYEAPSTLEAIVERLVRSRELAAAAAAAGADTFEEADDFEVEDEDYDPRFPETIYEAYFEAKSKRRAEAEARRQTVSQTASEGLVSPSPAASSAEKPTLPSDSPLNEESKLAERDSARPAPSK